MVAKLFFFAVLVHASFAFRFLFHNPAPVAQAEGREVQQSCLEHAQNGNCQFYNCFEQRLRCGREYYMDKHGLYYCNKIVSYMHRFTPAGQQFLRNVTRCLMEPLQEIYTRDFIDCHDLEHEAVAAIAPCFSQHNFCSVLRTDSHEFFRIFEFNDLFTRGATKLWRAIMTIATDCGSQYTREFTSETSETLLNQVNTFFNSLGSFQAPNFFGSDDSEEAA